jgi:hypothetical protein
MYNVIVILFVVPIVLLFSWCCCLLSYTLPILEIVILNFKVNKILSISVSFHLSIDLFNFNSTSLTI